MQVSQELMREHQLILKTIDAVLKLTEIPAKLEAVEYFRIGKQFVRFVEVFADDYHHAKEEEILFKALQEPGVLSHCDPIAQMMMEHDMARESLQLIKKAVSAHNLELFAKGVAQYAHILQQHIFKEDHVLYPMAEKSLDDQVKASIEREYVAVEAAKSKDALWQEFSEFLTQLEQTLAVKTR